MWDLSVWLLVFIFSSSLLLHSVWLYGCITVYLSSLLLMDIWVVSSLGQLEIKLLWIFSNMSFGGHMQSCLNVACDSIWQRSSLQKVTPCQKSNSNNNKTPEYPSRVKKGNSWLSQACLETDCFSPLGDKDIAQEKMTVSLGRELCCKADIIYKGFSIYGATTYSD